jgi:transcriptional regulator GlxA family with amidase domain
MPLARNKPRTSEVPQFSLYGEAVRPDDAESVHIELIETRSRIHDWHIAPHTHAGLFQVLFLMSGHVSALMEDEEVLAFLRAQAPGLRFLGSVCTGALVLVRLGRDLAARSAQRRSSGAPRSASVAAA